ncbi:adult-specific cuticular protein ACP-20-like [Topomyia yanbarensis]|uniref:adult-specific cuticular protein ACP-20-like n=1 Tax=Topomyia yanbarensis TaxID=2498891 RepID=UPI00273C76CF|nr:adult-specific cuticular protein ACP-20-like [Topomyia yanbarensis]
MIKFAVVTVALVGVTLAFEHYGFVNEVKHIPYKWYGGGQGGFGGGIGGGIGGDIGGGFGGGLGGGFGGGVGGGFGGGIGGGLGGGIGGGEVSLERHGLDYYSYPKYKYEYGVKDYHTGDHKSQWEVRDGDVVKGEYTLDEPDGTKRIVEYYADDKNGFEAKVKNIGHSIGGGQGGFGGEEGGFGGGYHGLGYSYSKLKKYN